MTTAAAVAICSAPSSNLSPHAAPFTLPARLPGRRQDEDKRSGDDSHSMSPIACVAMKSGSNIYPPSTHGTRTGQPTSWSGIRVDAYPSSICSTSVTISAPPVRMASNYKQQNPLTSGNRSKCSALKIESPPNETSETNRNSCSFRSKLVITEIPKSNKDTGKDTSFPRILQLSNPVGGNNKSQGATNCTKEANPVFNVKPLYIPTACADPCGFVADDVKPDPSECSVDSPCWRGASASRLSSFDVLQTSAPQSINQELKAFDSGWKQSSSTIQHYEAPAELQNLVSSKSKHNHSQSQLELGVSKKSGDIGTNQTKDSHGKEVERAYQCAAKCTTVQKHCLDLRDNCTKRSGLNYAAPDFVPSSIGKSKMGKGPSSSTGRNIPGILKAIENLTEVLRNSYSDDEIELEDHDYRLLESVIDNLQTCLHKKGKYNGSYIADGGKGIIINSFAGSSHMLNDFGKNSLTRSQPSLNKFPKKIPCEEEHPQVLVYKNLWIDAERANCKLKYQLKHTRMKIDLESSMAHTGGPRNISFQVSDLCMGPSNLYGAAFAHPTMLSFPKDHPTEETSGARSSQNLLHAGDCIQSGGNGALACSSSTKGYATLPKDLQGDHFLTGLGETGMHRHAHPGLQLAPNRAHTDGASTRSYITGMDGIFSGNPEYGSSDWEHVLKEEIGWS